MASSPSASPSFSTREVKYDVFLSFRGEDTGYNFTSHLHAALSRANIATFIDDELERGDGISPAVFNAIEESCISIIVFSRSYASSRWCLEELAKVIECKSMYGQIVIPVFYHVDQSEVRKQSGNFGDGFAILEEQFEADMVQRWRVALMEAASLSGFDSNIVRFESDLVEEVVKYILKILNYADPSHNKDLVGVQSSIEKIESLLSVGSKDVRIVGIWGMSGIGKTTIAKAVFDKIRSQFDGYFFAQNVREESESPDGLTSLRQKLLSAIFNVRHSNTEFSFIRQRLGCKMVFIVFDDVTSLEQIEFLIGDIKYLNVGSRITITARDKKVLENCGVDEGNIYKVEALFHHVAFQLFSWYAFQQNRPTLAYYELSNRVVKCAKGVPLALKVLGSLLCGRTKKVWKSTIEKLEGIPQRNIREVLKVSYDGLDDDEKNIFLDIACFFKWENIDSVIEFLEASGFFAEIGISVLIDKCLITLVNNKITMHDLLQEMGWEIAQQESLEYPGERSRLWCHVDIFHVLKKNMGTRAIEGICLDMSKMRDLHLNPNTFSRMHNLRFLKVYNSQNEDNNINKLHVVQGLESVFTRLSYLCWHGFPLKSLQSNFHPENLLALDIFHSNIEQLWTGAENFDNLKHINLSHSKCLRKIPDFSFAPNLESLILEGCTSLFEISSSIEHLKKLVILNLRHCESLESLPSNICKLKSLENLILSGCSKLQELPQDLGNLEALKVLEAKILAIREVPSSVVYLPILIELNLIDCCIMDLPNNISQLSSLKSLLLGGNNFEIIPTSIKDLPKLSYIDLAYCDRIQFLPELPSSLESIDAHNCISLESASGLSVVSATNWRSLRANFSNCFKLDQNSIKHILEDALQNIQYTMGFYPRPSASLCLPGNEIPEWFPLQNMGSSITLELPLGWFNSNFVTFVMCVIVEFQNYHDEDQGLVVSCDLRSRKEMVPLYHGTLKGWYDDIGSHYVASDHIFLGYDLCMFSNNFEHYGNEVNIQFDVEDLSTKPIDSCKVTKCGVYLLYSQETWNAEKVTTSEEKRPREKLDYDEEERLPRKKLKGAFL